MKKYFTFFVFWTMNGLLFAQNKTLPSPLDALLEKADNFTFENIDSALNYANVTLKLANEAHNTAYIFKAYRTIGYIYEENSLFNEAQNAYKNALNLAENNLFDFDKCAIYTDWAIINKKMGHYPIALDYHWRTIKKAEKMGNWELIESGYNGLGTLYAMTSYYEKAIPFYLKSIEAAEKWGNKMGVLLTEENICGIYLNTKNYDEARKTVVKTLNLALKLDDSVRIASVLNLYGDVEMALGNPDAALFRYKKAKAFVEQTGDKSKLSELYVSLGYFYFQQKNYPEARAHFDKCQELSAYLTPVCSADFYCKLGKLYAEENQIDKAIDAFNFSLNKTDTLGLKEIARDNHLALAKLLDHQNQPKEAYQHLLLANSLNDTLYANAQQKSITEARLKFDLEKRDLQIETQQHDLSQSHLVRTILGSFLTLVLILLFFVWRQMKAKLRAMRRIELLMKELHHRVKNNLQTVTSIMRLQARHITDPTILAVLAESRSRLEAISMIHQQLYRSDDVQSVNFKLFLEDLVEKQLFTHGVNDTIFDAQIKLEHEFMNVDVALPLGLIINELLTNSFKYAYPSVENPKLLIEIDTQNLLYSDNGQGLPPQFTIENSKSFGIRLIISLTQQLRGKFQFGNRNGMFFKLSF